MRKEITSVEQYIRALEECGIRLQNYARDMRTSFIAEAGYFFRGQKTEYVRINSSLSRNRNFVRNEHAMYAETLDAKARDLSCFHYPIEILAKMQHYGLPTRLMDFTIDPLIALFFATEDNDANKSGSVFVFKRPFFESDEKVPRVLSLIPTVTECSIEAIVNQYTKEFGEPIEKLEVIEAMSTTPFINYSDRNKETNPRLYLQMGIFAICGNKVTGEGFMSSELNELNSKDADVEILIAGVYKIQF